MTAEGYHLATVFQTPQTIPTRNRPSGLNISNRLALYQYSGKTIVMLFFTISPRNGGKYEKHNYHRLAGLLRLVDIELYLCYLERLVY